MLVCKCKNNDLYSAINSKLLLECFTRLLTMKAKCLPCQSAQCLRLLLPVARLLLPVAPTPHYHSFTHSICNCHPCTCLRCKQAWLLLLALCWPSSLSNGVFGSGLAFCCPPNWRHT